MEDEGIMSINDRNDINSYYYFNDEANEVCFKRHDMPTPWMNYFSNGTFHTMMSQAGGGVSFYKSPQIWRINRYRFFHLPTDRSGPYLYIRNVDTGDYWCPTCEPAMSKPQKWESAHGAGYTRFTAEKDGVKAILTYFVGPLENALIWNLKLSNTSANSKKLQLFSYVEFGMMEFMRELQWQCYNKHQVSVQYLQAADALVYKYGVEMQPKPAETPLVYFTSDRKTNAYDGDRDEFIGSYRSESNPYALENGGCTNSTLLGGDPCGVLQFEIKLEPQEETELNIFLGTAMTEEDILKSVQHVRQENFVAESFAALQSEWKEVLGKYNTKLPDKDTQRMVNIWNPYQAQRNFLFSRNISYYATGTFRGVGFRDTAQDVLAMVTLDVTASKEKTKLLLTQQYQDGHVNHYFFPNEGWEPVTSVHSDDHLWTIMDAWAIVMEEGNLSFLDEIVPFYDGEEATIYDHLKRAIEFSAGKLGDNGFPLMLRSDWNDALFRVCRKGKGESIWTSMQLGVVLVKMAELAKLTERAEEQKKYLTFYEQQKQLVNTIGWDGSWYRRAVMDDGNFLGTKEQVEAQIWLNTQTWSVLSNMADREKAITAMDSVKSILDTELGIKKVHPPIVNFPDPKDPLTNYNPGTGENGSVFCHANTWAIIAECLLGRGDIAYKYYHQLIPSVAMEKAGIWRYKAEPYVYASNLFGPDSDKFGMANVSWLTGTAAWMYIAVSQYILGLQPTWEGLKVDPCIPREWKGFEVVREFRGCRYDISVTNPGGISKGVKSVKVDGVEIEGNIIPHIAGRSFAVVNVEMNK